MNEQREIIYNSRNQMLDLESVREYVMNAFREYLVNTVNSYISLMKILKRMIEKKR
jgi:preprotein translocase subunit SecA